MTVDTADADLDSDFESQEPDQAQHPPDRRGHRSARRLPWWAVVRVVARTASVFALLGVLLALAVLVVAPRLSLSSTAPVLELRVARLGLSVAVAEGTDPRTLAAGPGHLIGSALPGEAGNAVLLGRRVTFGAPFRHLDRLRAGDEIVVRTPAGEFRYRVVAMATLAAGDLAPLAATDVPTLTLVTAGHGLQPMTRRVVRAVLVGSPTPAGAPLETRELRASDLGLDGSGSTGDAVLFWSVTLVASAAAGHLLFTHRPRRAVGKSAALLWRLAGILVPLAAAAALTWLAVPLLPGTL